MIQNPFSWFGWCMHTTNGHNSCASRYNVIRKRNDLPKYWKKGKQINWCDQVKNEIKKNRKKTTQIYDTSTGVKLISMLFELFQFGWWYRWHFFFSVYFQLNADNNLSLQASAFNLNDDTLLNWTWHEFEGTRTRVRN